MKILIVTKNWLGDILFEVPAFEMIRAHYPDAELIYMTHPRCREMLENHPAVDRILEFDEKSTHRSFGAKMQFVRMLKNEKIDAVYFFHRSRTRAFLAQWAGIKKRIGYSLKWPHFLTHPVPEPKKALHHVDHFVNLLVQAGFPKPKNPVYSFYHTAKDRLAAERHLGAADIQDFIVFHLGANWEPKRWPAGHFARLADMIHEKWRLPIVVTGSAKDQPLADEMKADVKSAHILYLIGKTGLGEAAAIFSRALFVISGDSGPMHIASAVGTRVVAIFGPTDPDLTGPRGKGETLLFRHIPEGYSAPWYGKNLPAEGWLSQVQPEQMMAELEDKKWNERALHGSSEFSGRMHKKDKHILVVTLTNIGDVIMNTSVIMSLAAFYPDHRITVVASPHAKGVLEGSRFIERIVVYDKRAGVRQKLHFLKELRDRSYEAVVDLKNTAIPFLVSAKKRSRLFRNLKSQNIRMRHLEVLKQMKLGVENIPPFDFYNEKDEASVFAKLRHKNISTDLPWIAMAPIAASELKTWPLEHFRQLIEGLLRETPHSIFLLGGEKDARLLHSTTAIAPDRIFNIAGLTTLRESAVLIGKSRLLVSHDSSVGHFGFDMNHPSVVIFGPTNPVRAAREGKNFRIIQESAPCVPCDKPFCRLERRVCLEDMSVKKVLQACLELLHTAHSDLLTGSKTSP